MMRHLTQRLGRAGWTLILAMAILLVSSQSAHAQFPAYGGGGIAVGYPFFGYGYGLPGMGYGYGELGYGYPIGGYGIGPYGMGGYGGIGYGMGYGGMGYGMGYGGMGYGGMGYGGMGYGGMGYGMGYGGFGYGGYGFYPNIYAQTSPLYNPLFGIGLTPLGAQSYMLETQLFGRRSRR